MLIYKPKTSLGERLNHDEAEDGIPVVFTVTTESTVFPPNQSSHSTVSPQSQLLANKQTRKEANLGFYSAMGYGVCVVVKLICVKLEIVLI